jgi:hypothetical protein
MAKRKNSGKTNIPQVGTIPNQAISPSRSKKANKKSTAGAITLARGTINRGKYTFVIKLALLTRPVALRERAVLKYVQGSRAVYAKTA